MAGGLGLAGCSFNNRTVDGGHLFAINTDGTTQRLALVVTRASDAEERIVSAVYRIPANTALRFEDVLAADETYRIRANQPDSGREGAMTVTTEQCDSDDPNDTVDVSVRIDETGELVLRPWQCDEGFVLQEGRSYAAPDEHRVSASVPGDS